MTEIRLTKAEAKGMLAFAATPKDHHKEQEGLICWLGSTMLGATNGQIAVLRNPTPTLPTEPGMLIQREALERAIKICGRAAKIEIVIDAPEGTASVMLRVQSDLGVTELFWVDALAKETPPRICHLFGGEAPDGAAVAVGMDAGYLSRLAELPCEGRQPRWTLDKVTEPTRPLRFEHRNAYATSWRVIIAPMRLETPA